MTVSKTIFHKILQFFAFPDDTVIVERSRKYIFDAFNALEFEVRKFGLTENEEVAKYAGTSYKAPYPRPFWYMINL